MGVSGCHRTGKMKPDGPGSSNPTLELVGGWGYHVMMAGSFIWVQQ